MQSALQTYQNGAFTSSLTSQKSVSNPRINYDYGYNGMEKDDEAFGEGNSYTTEFRQYDPRLGRWMSLDPLQNKFPWVSPYVAFENNPILFLDLKGKSPHLGGLFVIGAMTSFVTQLSVHYALNGGNLIQAIKKVDLFDVVMTGFETAITGPTGLQDGLSRTFAKIASSELVKASFDFSFEKDTRDPKQIKNFTVKIAGVSKDARDVMIEVASSKIFSIVGKYFSDVGKDYTKSANKEVLEMKRLNNVSKKDMMPIIKVNDVVQSVDFEAAYKGVSEYISSIGNEISSDGIKSAVNNFAKKISLPKLRDKTPANVADKTTVKNPFKFKNPGKYKF